MTKKSTYTEMTHAFGLRKGENAVRFEFGPCPDCGYKPGEYEYGPDFKRENILAGGDVVTSFIYAECVVCEWRTKSHSNVGECAKEWNETDLYPLEVGPKAVLTKLPSKPVIWCGD